MNGLDSSFLVSTVCKSGSMYISKFKIGGFIVSSIGASLSGIDISIINYVSLPLEISSIGLPFSDLSLPIGEVYKEPSILGPVPQCSPIHPLDCLSQIYIKGLPFKFCVGIVIVSIGFILNLTFCFISFIINDLISGIKSLTGYGNSSTGGGFNTSGKRKRRQSYSLDGPKNNGGWSNGGGGNDGSGKGNGGRGYSKAKKRTNFNQFSILIQLLLNILHHTGLTEMYLPSVPQNETSTFVFNLDSWILTLNTISDHFTNLHPEFEMAFNSIIFILENFRSTGIQDQMGHFQNIMTPENREGIMADLYLLNNTIIDILRTIHPNFDGSLY